MSNEKSHNTTISIATDKEANVHWAMLKPYQISLIAELPPHMVAAYELKARNSQ